MCRFAYAAFAALSVSVHAATVPFSPRETIAGSFFGASTVAPGDLDRDGDLDFVIAGTSNGWVALGRNNGTGTNGTLVLLDTNFPYATRLDIGDLDRDGDPDVAAVAQGPGLLVWWAQGATPTNWTRVTVSTNYAGPRDIRIADIDSDGDADLVTAGQFANQVTWWENRNNLGTLWSQRVVQAAISEPAAIAVADLDRDGRLDVISSSTISNRIAWWRNVNGSGTVWSASLIATNPSVPVVHRVADVDGDGAPDIVTTYFSGNVRWWRNNGSASAWTEHVVETNFSSPSDARVLDLDRDGDQDVVGISFVDDLIVWWENLDGAGASWRRATVDTAFKGATAVRTGDVDGDGDEDLFGAESDTGSIPLWRNATPGNRTFFGHTNGISLAAGATFSARLGDINGDGQPDAVSATTNGIFWYAGAADGTSWTTSTVAAGGAATHAELADLDQDGDLDIVGADTDGYTVRWWQNLTGTGSAWQARTIAAYAGSQAPIEVAVGDVDRDGRPDVAAIHNDPDRIQWFRNTGGATNWTTNLVSTAYEDGQSLRLADLDGDGDLDIAAAAAVGAGSTNTVAWFQNLGGGANWLERPVNAAGEAFADLSAVDFDRDGDVDLLGTGGDPNVEWYENAAGNGSTWITHGVETTCCFFAGSEVAPMDADFDGDLDILYASQGYLIYYENDGTDTNFLRHIVCDEPGDRVGRALDVGDVNRDGLPDVLYAQSPGGIMDQGALRWFRNSPHGDLQVTKQAASDPAYRGRRLIYGVVVTNKTPHLARNVTVTDTLPDQVAWVSDTTGGPAPVSNVVTWSLGDLAGNTRTSVIIEVLIDYDHTGFITNRATFAATLTDTNPADDLAVLTTRVEYAEDILISATSDTVAVEAGDLDRDGDLDIVALSATIQPNVRWFENTAPDGEAWLPHSIANITPVEDLDLADMDRDGDTDVVVSLATPNQVLWYANDGTGGVWNSQIIYGNAGQPRGVATADLDGDGDLDVLAAGTTVGFQAYENETGTGGVWTARVVDNALDSERAIQAADFDLDGDMDFVGGAANVSGAGGVKWYQNVDGSGTTWSGFTLATTAFSYVWCGDVDRDGDPDIVAGEATNNVWWENRREGGTNWTRRTLGGAPTTRSLGGLDVDRDGDLDLLRGTSLGLQVLRNLDGTGAAWTTNAHGTNTVYTALAVGDINRDGALDVVAGSDGADSVFWLRMPVRPAPTNFPNQRNVDTNAPGAIALAAADFDRDGDLDLAGALGAGDRMLWWRNISNAAAWTVQAVDTNIPAPLAAVAADLDGDGDMDLVAPSFDGNRVLWWANEGGTSWLARTVLTNYNNATASDAADFDLDGDLDLVVARPTLVNAVQWFSNLNGTATAWSTNDMPGTTLLPLSVHAARITPDARPDVVVGCASGLLLYANNANTNFVRTVVDNLLDDVVDVDSADLDGDGDADILGATEDGNRLYWWMNSNGLASSWARYPINVDAVGATGLRPVDLDSDGDLDVVATLQDTNQVIWMENLGGATGWIQHVVQDGFALAVAPVAADLNRDGDPDLAAASRGGDLVAWWPQLEGAPDYDGDGLSDDVDPDDDNDGMPDDFEVLNGLNPFDPADAPLDSDGDTFPNLEEYFADTLPTNGLSYLRIAMISNAPPIRVLFSGSIARVYTLQFSTTLTVGAWSDLAGQVNVPGAGDGQSLVDTNAAAARAYRVQAAPP